MFLSALQINVNHSQTNHQPLVRTNFGPNVLAELMSPLPPPPRMIPIRTILPAAHFAHLLIQP